VEGAELGLCGWRGGGGFANLLVLLPRSLLALGGAEVADFAPCARFRCAGLADIALASRFLQHVLHLDQLSLVVLHVLDERTSGVVGAEDLYVDELLGEVLSEEGGEGGRGDVGGGEAEDLEDLLARLELGDLCPLEGCFRVNCVFVGEGKWVPMDHSKSKKHEGLAVYLAAASNTSKKFRIVVFEHFTHQLVIVLIDELVAVCIRS